MLPLEVFATAVSPYLVEAPAAAPPCEPWAVSDGAIRIGVMLGVGGFVTIGYDGLPPRTVSVRTLPGGSIGTGVRIICLGHTPASVRTVGRSTARIRSGVRIVGSTGRGSSVRTVDSARNSVGASICIIIRTYTIGARIRTINAGIHQPDNHSTADSNSRCRWQGSLQRRRQR